MKAHGEDVAINCGDRVVHWKSTAAVKAEKKGINEAFVMFRTAYEEKGLLPKARDAAPTPAPWPTLTLPAADNQPLREREECWTAFPRQETPCGAGGAALEADPRP